MESREELFVRNRNFSIISLWMVFKAISLDKITKEIIIIIINKNKKTKT